VPCRTTTSIKKKQHKTEELTVSMAAVRCQMYLSMSTPRGSPAFNVLAR
jgi:hypothetical protein